MFQVPRRVLPPQKAYNLRGVVSEEANLEQNSATFSSRLKWLRVKSGHLGYYMLVKEDIRAACAEYLFKANIKKYYCQYGAECAVHPPK